jgi:hypothetical protein
MVAKVVVDVGDQDIEGHARMSAPSLPSDRRTAIDGL